MCTLETVLLLALPASGKSEVRTYLAHQSAEVLKDEFHLGPSVQLDDFPYVHLMRCIDQALAAEGESRVFFSEAEGLFIDGRDWGLLIELINEDYAELTAPKAAPAPEMAVKALFERVDRAGERLGISPRLVQLDAAMLQKLDGHLRAEAEAQLREKAKLQVDSLAGKTVIIEFARGGPEGGPLPIEAPQGYAHSLACLSPEILKRASVLYVWVSPEESRRKNRARADPNDPGSILNHGVPEVVMREEYGMDDMAWLLSQSQSPGCIEIQRDGETYRLPVSRFDNREDATSFVRDRPSAWPAAEKARLHEALAAAFGHLAQAGKE